MITALLLLIALCCVVFGLLFIVGSALPRFGGGAEPHALPVGIVLLVLGLWLIFKAGAIQ